MEEYYFWKQEEEHSFKGWDFSYLDGRMYEDPLPWNYHTILLNYLKSTDRILDMGTGGGEFLLSLNHPSHLTSVTESFEPNVKLCLERLEPLGIEVKQVFVDSELPFNDDTFDVVINRHESYCLDEVKRILKPNGLFITQQVGGLNNERLSKQLIQDFKPQFLANNLNQAISDCNEKNFMILQADEYFPSLRFFDMGAIVYFAKIIEWEFPNFSVDTCYAQLCELQKQLEQNGYVESFEHRFLLIAQNTKHS